MRAVIATLTILLAARAQDGASGGPHAGVTADMDCSNCHSTHGWRMSETTGGEGGFDHAKTGFPLIGQHGRTTCASCHRGGPVTMACSSCHSDPHARRLGDDCSACHTATAWFDTDALARHRRSRLPLVGRHAVIECAACHQRQGARTYAATPADCFSCHARDYRGNQHPDHDGDAQDPAQEAFPRQCARCHTPFAWSPALVQPQMGHSRGALVSHDAHFVISIGPHRTVPCNECHPSTERRKAVTCTGCHQGTQLRRQHRRTQVSGATRGCLRCHPQGHAR